MKVASILKTMSQALPVQVQVDQGEVQAAMQVLADQVDGLVVAKLKNMTAMTLPTMTPTKLGRW